MKFYHATAYDNLADISTNGIEIRSFDGVVYLCKKPEDCLKFMLVRGIADVLICEVNIPESWVIETFEHAEAIFQCRCYGSTKPIPAKKIISYYRYDISNAVNNLSRRV